MKCSFSISFLLSFVCCFLLVLDVSAHPDLEAQIELLTEKISAQPQNAELLIKRGDLYRRHGDWVAGVNDFQAVRAMNPRHPMVDWYEGRLLVAAGRFNQADVLLTRFLGNSPNHAGACQARARARLALEQPLLAANDFQNAIEHSERPSPSLYRSLVLSLVAAGSAQMDAAIIAVNQGLLRFPGEISLLGLGTDLSLAQSNPGQSLVYMSEVPERLRALLQWQFRQAVQVCIEGDVETAGNLFSELLDRPDNNRQKAGTWAIPSGLVNGLMTSPRKETCSKAAWEILRKQRP